MSEPLADRVDPAPVLDRTVRFEGLVWDVITESFVLPGVGELRRDFVDHPGAVAVLAMDPQERVLLIQQYRHPTRPDRFAVSDIVLTREIPAGLRDVDGEDERVCAERELAEEADLRAATWALLSRYAASPGGMNEHLTIFLATDLSAVPEAERHQRTGEEAVLVHRWVPLDELLEAILAGDIRNATVMIAALTAYVRKSRAGEGLSQP